MREIRKILLCIDDGSVALVALMQALGAPYSASEPVNQAGHPQLEAALQHLASAATAIQQFSKEYSL